MPPNGNDSSSSSGSSSKSTVADTRWRNLVHQSAQGYYNAVAAHEKGNGNPSLAACAYLDATARGLSSVLPKGGAINSLALQCQATKLQFVDLPKKIQGTVEGLGSPQEREDALKEVVGDTSLMGKEQPLHAAMQRKALRGFFKKPETLNDILETLNQLDAEATSRVLKDAREKSTFYALNKDQRALLVNMADQETAKQHLPAFAALAVTMGKSSNAEVRETAASLVTKVNEHARQCLAAGETEPVVDVASMLACSPVKAQAQAGNCLAYDLVKSGKLQEKAKLEMQAQPLNQLLSLREFADKHENGTGKFCLEEALDTSGKLLVTARSNKAGQEKLNSLHQVHLNAHANTLKDDPTSIDKAGQAAKAAMDDKCPGAVDNLISTLAHDNRKQSVTLASEIVRSPEFMKTFGTAPVADPMDVVDANLKEPQANVGTATAQLMVAQAEWRLNSGAPGSFTPSISPKQLGAAARLFQQEDDVEKVQGCLDLLCKYQQTGVSRDASKEARKLFEDVWKEKTETYQSLLMKPAAEPVEDYYQSPGMNWVETDEEDQVVSDAWEASDQLIELAGFARTMQAYSAADLPEIDKIKGETNAVFEQALARMDYSGAVQLAAVHEALLSEDEAAAEYQSMAGKLLAESQDHLANRDYDKALSAAQACLGIASRDRETMQLVLGDVEKLREDIATNLDVSMMVDDTTQGHEVLLDACQKQPQLIPAANDLNDAITKANQTLTLLDKVQKKIGKDPSRKALGADPDHHADRFKGEVNTGCPDVHAFRYSSGTDAGADDNDATLALAHTAAAAVQSAYMDFCKADFSRWDVSKTHVRKLGELQKNWAEAEKRLPGDDATMETARQALLFDLNHIDQLKANPKKSDKPYIKEMRETWKDCGKDVESFIQARTAMHSKTPPDDITLDYSKSSVAMLSAQAGYLLEERMYQLLPDETRLQWNEQNTTLFPKGVDENGEKIKGSRPDIVQTFDGKHNVCLDLTAQNSAGHIFKKTNAWIHDEVTEAIEITYPSIPTDILKQAMLQGKSVDMEAIKAAGERAAQTQRLKEQTRQLYKDCAEIGDGGKLRQELKKLTQDISPEAAAHLAHWAGFDDASDYGALAGPVDEDYAEKAMLKLREHAQDIAESQQEEMTLPKSLASFLPEKAQKIHADLRLADELEKDLNELQTAEKRVTQAAKNMKTEGANVTRHEGRLTRPRRGVAQNTIKDDIQAAKAAHATATEKHAAAVQKRDALESALVEKIKPHPFCHVPYKDGVAHARTLANIHKANYYKPGGEAVERRDAKRKMDPPEEKISKRMKMSPKTV